MLSDNNWQAGLRTGNMKQGSHFHRGELKGVGRRFRLLRLSRGWSLKKLSDISDISVATIRKIELGISNPSLLTVLALVEALDEPVDRLINEAISGRRQSQLVRADEVQKSDGRVQLSNDVDNRRMAGHQCTLGAGELLSMLSGERPVFGYVIDGEVVLKRHDGREYRCSRGDAFHAIELKGDEIRGATCGATLLVVEQSDESHAAAGAISGNLG
jgi:transcriptional regulator with XRE-family HTH domain